MSAHKFNNAAANAAAEAERENGPTRYLTYDGLIETVGGDIPLDEGMCVYVHIHSLCLQQIEADSQRSSCCRQSECMCTYLDGCVSQPLFLAY